MGVEQLHLCSFPSCTLGFPSRSELDSHLNSHPAYVDALRQANHAPKKARWTLEEKSLMARKEAELVTELGSGVMKVINQKLHEHFSARTLEAIKGQRKSAAYKALVERKMEEISRRESTSEQSPQPRSDQVPVDLINSDVNSIVQEAESLGPSFPVDNSGPIPADSQVDLDRAFLGSMREHLPRADSQYNTDELCDIINSATLLNKVTTYERFSLYMIQTFPSRRSPGGTGPRPANIVTPRNRKERRRQEYACVQKSWKKDQKRTIENILKGISVTAPTPTPDQALMEPYWRRVFEETSVSKPADEITDLHYTSLYEAITLQEVKKARIAKKTSPGPDGVTVEVMKRIPMDILCSIFNLMLWCGAPQGLVDSRTIFIPKSADSKECGDFRPLTIPSIFVRKLHTILAKRFNDVVELRMNQRGFRTTDGTADCAVLLDTLLRNAHGNLKTSYFAFLDISKAFDTVSHATIFGTLKSMGIPVGIRKYLEDVYIRSRTQLSGSGWNSDWIHPNRGVKQGDPLSPVLFNMVVDRMIRCLPIEIGAKLDEVSMNSLFYADDGVLMSETPIGLQILLDKCTMFFGECGMRLNPSKCFTISIKALGKEKQTFVEQRTFTIGQNNIPCLNRESSFRYLGVYLTPNGIMTTNPQRMIVDALTSIGKAPLKPQQRLHALRTMLIPKLYHECSLGMVNIGCLITTDRKVRSAVRKWLNLPEDVPIGYFHASVKDGGLGIPSLRLRAPLLRYNRLKRLSESFFSNYGLMGCFLVRDLDSTSRRLRIDASHLIQRSRDIETYFRDKLNSSVDGSGLREASKVPLAHRWVREPTTFLSGRDYVNNLRLRIGALPSASRTSRGRPSINRMCRAGCERPETVNHILQNCFRCSRGRHDRHESIINYISRKAESAEYSVHNEPHIPTSVGLRKPDLIVTRGQIAIVFDAQVNGDQFFNGWDLDASHEAKKSKYSTIPEVERYCRDVYGVSVIRYTSATLNWRGIWSQKSASELIDFNLIKTNDLAVISTRVMLGGTICFRMFNETTMMRRSNLRNRRTR